MLTIYVKSVILCRYAYFIETTWGKASERKILTKFYLKASKGIAL